MKGQNDGELYALLAEKARAIRKGILKTIGVNKKGHLGGSMSSADIVAALYFYKMNHNPEKKDDPDRDRFIFSKGHSALAQYAALAECGYFPKSEFARTKTLGSMLQGHPEQDRTPGVEANTGSLGQGLSIGVGMALGGRLDGRSFRVYVIVGDGELGEGQIWEAVTTASFYQLDNLTAIIDHNKLQASGRIEEKYDLGDLRARFEASGWRCFEIDGHRFEEIVEALDAVDDSEGVPTAIIAHTVKGRGVSFAEDQAGFHNSPLTKEQYERAWEEVAKEG